MNAMQTGRNFPPRRGPGPMVSQHPPQPTAAQVQLEAQKRENARRQSKIPTDRDIPDGIEDLAIGDGVQSYKSLRDVEKRLDAIMMRKRLDQNEGNGETQRKHHTMRIWISNTAENQPWQQTSMDHEAFDFGDSSNNATYRVKIEGRLIGDDDDLVEKSDSDAPPADGEAIQDDGNPKNPNRRPSSIRFPSRTRFSHFFKQITVDFDRNPNLQPDQIAQVEWKKPAPPKGPPNPASANVGEEVSFDCIEFERKSDENMNITINLVRDEKPERYKLSPAMADLLGTEIEDRAGVIMGVWAYVRAQKLQRDDEMTSAQCDTKLKNIFNCDILSLKYLAEAILPHCTALPPIQLTYTVRVDSAYASNPTPTIYDITVTDVIAPLSALYPSSSTPLSHLQELARLDNELAITVQAMQHSKAKHAFLTSMSRDPVSFIKRWMASQRRDMEVILGEASRGQDEHAVGEEWRRGGKDSVWGSHVARESVALFLSRQKMSP